MEMLEVLPEITMTKECGAQENPALLEPTLMASPPYFFRSVAFKKGLFCLMVLIFFSFQGKK